MLTPGSGISVPPDPETLGAVLGTLLRIYAFKNPLYGNSWCKRGEISAFENVSRKYDRIFTAVVDRRVSPGIDDLMDLPTYAMAQAAYHLERRLGQYRDWERRMQDELDAQGAPGF